MNTNVIERLARLRGIGDAYHDYRGELRHFSVASKTALLRAMGCSVDDPPALAAELDELEATQFRRLLPQVATARGPRLSVELNIPARQFGASLQWEVILEDGSRRGGTSSTADCPELWRGEVEGAWITRRRFDLAADLPPGYHELEIGIAGLAARCLLVIAPAECFEPPVIVRGGKLWGMSVQLYTVRSRDNWGMGDFGDLRRLVRWLAPRGAGFIGLNPLHALAPADPQRCSPYSASNRHFLNVLYISVPDVAEYDDCAAARARTEDPAFRERVRALRESTHVDHAGVASVKLEILDLLFRDFRERHLDLRTPRAAEFRDFVARGGALLHAHALFDALDRHFCTTLRTPSGWPNWPADYRRPDGEAPRRFAADNESQLDFFLYLQWLAHQQLTAAQSLARELGMPLGLYGDYAVGSNPGGSETWTDQTSYRMGAEIGAPPDNLALRGQGWGIPPLDPVALESQRLQGFVRLLRDNMRYYGALRLDHVMSLFRLWWVASGASPTEGAYVHYPLQQLLSVLALESVRCACLVVGEDLGVVPEEMRRAMPEYGLYHYKVVLFEKQDGRFLAPDRFVRRALGTVTTHDMPTLRSYWERLDIDLRQRLNLFPTPESVLDVVRERDADQIALLEALGRQGLLPSSPAAPSEPFTSELAQALHRYLARSNTVLAALQVEDLLGMIDPVNVPGTDREYPNWQRKLNADVEDMAARPDYDAAFAEIGRERALAAGGGTPG